MQMIKTREPTNRKDLMDDGSFTNDRLQPANDDKTREGNTLQSIVYNRADGNRSSLQQASVVTMLSVTQITTVSTGRDIKMQCEFHMHGYDMFSNPIIWEKTQQLEKSRINIQGVILHPFAASKRFSITFSKDVDSRYTVSLFIKEARLEDAGNYTCEVRGGRSMILNHVTHVLNVAGVLYSLRITTSTWNKNDTGQPSSITMNEDDPKILQCISNSTCPAPQITFHLGKSDLSSALQWSQETSSMSGALGLRVMFCSVTKWMKLILKERDDRKILKCSIESGLHQPNWTEILINIYYAPIIQCEPAAARLGENNVTLECSVRAKPDLGTLYWVIDSNGTTMSSNERNNEYTILVRVRDDNTLIIQLILASAKRDSFRQYFIEAGNAIGSTRTSVLLDIYQNELKGQHRGHLVQPSSSRLLNYKEKTYLESRASSHNLFPSFMLTLLAPTFCRRQGSQRS